MAKWIETKQECEVDQKGNRVVKRVTLELERRKYLGLEKKDLIDISLRLIALAAIFIPLWLFYSTQRAERERQKAALQIDVYSKASTELHGLVEAGSIDSRRFDSISNRLFLETYPKLLFISDDAIADTFKLLKNIVFFYKKASDFRYVADSMYPRTVHNPAILPFNRSSHYRDAAEKALMNFRYNLDTYHNQHYIFKLENVFTLRFQQATNNFYGAVSAIHYDQTLAEEAFNKNFERARVIDTSFGLCFNQLFSLRSRVVALADKYREEGFKLVVYYRAILDSMMTKSNTILYSE